MYLYATPCQDFFALLATEKKWTRRNLQVHFTKFSVLSKGKLQNFLVFP